MIPTLLVLAAVAAWAWPNLAPLVEKIRAKLPELTPRHYAGAALLAAAVAYAAMPAVTAPAPGPTPAPDAGPLSLEGLFAGPTASEDAILVGSMCDEIADEIQFASGQPEGYLATGVAVDELRRRVREFRCRGISIGDRQPAARDAIAKYLEAAVGTDGGPLSAEQRSAWVSAYRDVGRAATDAAQ
jgi:hypothetical protein